MTAEADFLNACKHWTTDTIRYGDTDRLGHVNNAVFSTYLETGRVALLFDDALALMGKGQTFVIARLVLDYKREILWPGSVRIGTGLEKIGRSSLLLKQAIVQNDCLCAEAETTIVLIDEASRKSTPLSPEAIAMLKPFELPRKAADGSNNS